jgi:5'-deoxynucleotidase YfbR-like HD superfamily hydrolase
MSVQSISNGSYFDLDNMDRNTIDIRTVAQSLSRIPRFLGHTEVAYSVAQHSVMVSDLVRSYDPRVRLAALMHDAHESITGDITTPVKQYLRQSSAWKKLEHRLEDFFATTFSYDVDVAHGELVKEADNMALWIERQAIHQAFAEDDWGYAPEGVRKERAEVEVAFFWVNNEEEAFNSFLNTYYNLLKEIALAQ